MPENADPYDTPSDRRTIEILSRALAWHGDLIRMATTREDWQQTIDTAISWVKANPENGRPSFPTYPPSQVFDGWSREDYAGMVAAEKQNSGMTSLADANREHQLSILKEELTNLKRGIDASVWHYHAGERLKRILVAESTIERIDAALSEK